MPKPTVNEVEADKFDLELNRLLRRAEANADAHPNWLDACAQLRCARSKVRAMMSEEDRVRTQ